MKVALRCVLTAFALAVPATAYANPFIIGTSAGVPQYHPAAMPFPTDGFGTASRASVVRAHVALAEGRYADADNTLRLILTDGSLDPEVFVMAGLASLGSGSPGMATKWFERGLSLDSNDVRARQGLALALLADGKRDAAQRQYTKLKNRLEQCEQRCVNRKPLKQAVASLDRVLR